MIFKNGYALRTLILQKKQYLKNDKTSKKEIGNGKVIIISNIFFQPLWKNYRIIIDIKTIVRIVFI